MLWYNAWLETRWRFLIGLALVLCSAGATVMVYPRVLELIPAVSRNAGGPLAEKIREAARIEREYRGYIWLQWFHQNLAQWATLFTILIGGTRWGSPLFTFSLPVSRSRLLGVRAATGIAEVFALSFAPSLLILLVSPGIDQQYAIGDALVHSAFFFIGMSPVFALAVLFSTAFDDAWRGPAAVIAFVLAANALLRGRALQLLSGESYFRRGDVPWMGLTLLAAVAAALYLGAQLNLARREF